MQSRRPHRLFVPLLQPRVLPLHKPCVRLFQLQVLPVPVQQRQALALQALLVLPLVV
jgi:hypothetical protein